LVAEPGAAGHFHAAFFVNSEALGGDYVAFFDDVFDLFGAAFGVFDTWRARLLPAILQNLLVEFVNRIPGVGVFESDFIA
jgi:hypothetical protein